MLQVKLERAFLFYFPLDICNIMAHGSLRDGGARGRRLGITILFKTTCSVQRAAEIAFYLPRRSHASPYRCPHH